MAGETILVTRPSGDEKILTDLLHERGYRVIHEPLTRIYLNHTERQSLEAVLDADPHACIVTSRHGVRALAALSEMRDHALICVGDATARVAQSLGFTRIAVAGGTSEKLVDYILGAYDEGSRFAYIRGAHVQGDMDKALNDAQMQVQSVVLYEAAASPQLSDTLIEQLKREQIDAVTLLSTRTAHIFNALLKQAGIEDSVRHLHGFTLSAAIAQPLQGWKQLYVADEPTLASVLACVDNAFQS